VAAHGDDFYWDNRNIEAVEKHGLTRWDVQHVVRSAKQPFPERFAGRASWRVIGKTPTYRRIEVLYFIGRDKLIHVYHAM
jgi:hypothetical protein